MNRSRRLANASRDSIVAVHGVGGDVINTWTHPKSKAFWLKDILPRQIPDARIMTFGYNADAARTWGNLAILLEWGSSCQQSIDRRDYLTHIKILTLLMILSLYRQFQWQGRQSGV